MLSGATVNINDDMGQVPLELEGAKLPLTKWQFITF